KREVVRAGRQERVLRGAGAPCRAGPAAEEGDRGLSLVFPGGGASGARAVAQARGGGEGRAEEERQPDARASGHRPQGREHLEVRAAPAPGRAAPPKARAAEERARREKESGNPKAGEEAMSRIK